LHCRGDASLELVERTADPDRLLKQLVICGALGRDQEQ
jgi:hypothetical protein